MVPYNRKHLFWQTGTLEGPHPGTAEGPCPSTAEGPFPSTAKGPCLMALLKLPTTNTNTIRGVVVKVKSLNMIRNSDSLSVVLFSL
jgi:hypothetical protein